MRGNVTFIACVAMACFQAILGSAVEANSHENDCPAYQTLMQTGTLPEVPTVDELKAQNCVTPAIMSILRKMDALKTKELGILSEHPIGYDAYAKTEIALRELQQGRMSLDTLSVLQTVTQVVVLDFSVRRDFERMKLYKLAYSRFLLDSLIDLSENSDLENLSIKRGNIDKLPNMKSAICLTRVDNPRVPLSDVLSSLLFDNCMKELKDDL